MRNALTALCVALLAGACTYPTLTLAVDAGIDAIPADASTTTADASTTTVDASTTTVDASTTTVDAATTTLDAAAAAAIRLPEPDTRSVPAYPAAPAAERLATLPLLHR